MTINQMEEYIAQENSYWESKRKRRPACKVCGKPVSRMCNIYCSRTCKNKELGFQPRGITSYSGLYWKLQKIVS